MNCLYPGPWRLGLAVLLMGPLALATEPSGAQYSLSWSRSAEAESCPDRAALVQAVARQLGRDPFPDGATRSLSVEFSREGATWVVAIHAHDPGGVDVGAQRFTSDSPDCGEVTAATVAALAVMVGDVEAPPEPPLTPPPTVRPAQIVQPEPEPAPRPPIVPARPAAPRHWIGLELAEDLAYVAAASNVCPGSSSPSDPYDCYYSNSQRYQGVPVPNQGNKVAAGLGAPSGRLIAGYQTQLWNRLWLEARLGVTVSGRVPKTFPVLAEVGARYWLNGSSASWRAFVGAGAGLARFDVETVVAVLTDQSSSGVQNPPIQEKLLARRRYGIGFVSGSVGAFWKVAAKDGLLIRTAVIATFPATGFVLEPSLGYAHGW